MTGRRRIGYDDVVVTTPVTVPYARHSPNGAHWFIAQALAGLLRAASLPKKAIDGLSIASFTLTPDTAIGVTQYLGLSGTWLDHIQLGGASGIVCLRRALRAVQAGDAEIVACIGADSNQPDSFSNSLENFSVFSRDAVYPYASGGPNASFALITAHYMRQWGATRSDFGKMCVAQRQNALNNPLALFTKPLTLEEYLNAKAIADPIHLFDCVMPCAGAEAFLVMTRERAESLHLPYARVLSTCERHNAFQEDPIQTRGGWALDKERLFGDAGVDHRDISCVQTYDDYPVMSIIQLEDLGFCAKGDGPDFVRRNDFTVQGSFPLNTSGGQLSVGQAGCAGGFLGIVEAMRQLTDQPIGTLVTEAQFALAVGFGMIVFDRGLCSGAAILARGN